MAQRLFIEADVFDCQTYVGRLHEKGDCGESLAHLMGEVLKDIQRDPLGGPVTVTFHVRNMTDAEVDALPEP
ncbi:hypothetical protein SAMN05421753_104222 [Planctomicrobium piriforme]|uniref:Uncharacterized protein n=1 Tax=Planctomicrobium piriforme TaxID=1576369 RepID=A0A1I3EI11_9PLAN|nr:hypothetical protein SAMN05421753_104222 [Planctomicrobium piriforme]